MEAVEIFLALPLLEDLATVLFTLLFDCIFGRFTVVFLTDEPLLLLLEELLLIEGLDTTALLLVTELPLPLLLLVVVVLFTVL